MPRWDIDWNRELVIEKCREADATRIAADNMVPLNTRDLRSDPNLPSIPTVEKYVGNMDDLQKALGRITTKIAREWDDETWKQNAQWAQQVLEAEGTTYMTQPHICRLASAGLMPNESTITERWVSIPAYRAANGIEKRDIRIEAKQWSKEDFINNGRQFSLYLGQAHGFAIMPTQDKVSAGIAENRLPTMRQIQKAHGSLEQYQIDLGFVNVELLSRWTEEQWKENFAWLRDVFEENNLPFTSLRSILTIASSLNLGPSVDLAVKYWGDLSSYGKLVGFESKQFKRQISDEGIVRAIINERLKFHRPLTTEDLKGHVTASANLVKRRFGGIGKVNLMLGEVTWTKGWVNDKLLWWGVTSFIESAGHYPSDPEIIDWSTKKKGPSTTKIYSHFASLSEYHEQLSGAKQWLDCQIETLNAVHRLPGQLFRIAIRRNPELFHPGKDLTPQDFELFTRLKQSGVDMKALTAIMDKGISFSDPKPDIDTLSAVLDAGNSLNTYSLRRLMPYIIGLAPPEVEMRWLDYIREYRKTIKPNN